MLDLAFCVTWGNTMQIRNKEGIPEECCKAGCCCDCTTLCCCQPCHMHRDLVFTADKRSQVAPEPQDPSEMQTPLTLATNQM